jgi:hypothetical protein
MLRLIAVEDFERGEHRGHALALEIMRYRSGARRPGARLA